MGGFDWSALIPVGSALVGGLLGFGSAMIASRRATQTAFEQVRYSRLQERQYETLARLYGYANRLHQSVYWVCRGKDRIEVLQRSIEGGEIFREANNYLQDNTLWLSDETTFCFLDFMDKIAERRKGLSDLAREIPLEDPRFEQKRQETRDWLKGEGIDNLGGIHKTFSETLGLTGWHEDPRAPTVEAPETDTRPWWRRVLGG